MAKIWSLKNREDSGIHGEHFTPVILKMFQVPPPPHIFCSFCQLVLIPSVCSFSLTVHHPPPPNLGITILLRQKTEVWNNEHMWDKETPETEPCQVFVSAISVLEPWRGLMNVIAQVYLSVSANARVLACLREKLGSSSEQSRDIGREIRVIILHWSALALSSIGQ